VTTITSVSGRSRAISRIRSMPLPSGRPRSTSATSKLPRAVASRAAATLPAWAASTIESSCAMAAHTDSRKASSSSTTRMRVGAVLIGAVPADMVRIGASPRGAVNAGLHPRIRVFQHPVAVAMVQAHNTRSKGA